VRLPPQRRPEPGPSERLQAAARRRPAGQGRVAPRWTAGQQM